MAIKKIVAPVASVTAKQQIRANIGQSIVNTTEIAVAGTRAVADAAYLISDLTSFIRRELRED